MRTFENATQKETGPIGAGKYAVRKALEGWLSANDITPKNAHLHLGIAKSQFLGLWWQRSRATTEILAKLQAVGIDTGEIISSVEPKEPLPHPQ